MPGEISLANNGVLLLDEFPEFNRTILEGLRTPLEEKKVTISRTKLKKTLPADFLLIATLNPCKCGYFNHPKIVCRCQPIDVRRYRGRISGPILDRVDVKIKFDLNSNINKFNEYKNNSYEEFLKLKSKIEEVRNKVDCILSNNSTNNFNILSSNVFEHLSITENITNFLIKIQDNYSISNRRLLKILKLSKTISFFEEREEICISDIQEAFSLSSFDNN
jgi:magnesium chelatase family protein